MSTIKKPEANPVVALLLTWFVINTGHLIINGQTKKFVMTLVAQLIGTVLCVIPGIILGVLSIVDSYQTAQRLQNGEEIPENEYSNPMLFKVCKMLDKTATCKNA